MPTRVRAVRRKSASSRHRRGSGSRWQRRVVSLDLEGLPFVVETFPDRVAFAAEGVEGHRDVRWVALAVLNELPVVAEAGDEADVVFHPAVGDVTGFDQVDDGEQHQRLVRGDAAELGAGDVEVGEFAEPGPLDFGACLHRDMESDGAFPVNPHRARRREVHRSFCLDFGEANAKSPVFLVQSILGRGHRVDFVADGFNLVRLVMESLDVVMREQVSSGYRHGPARIQRCLARFSSPPSGLAASDGTSCSRV